MKKNVAFIIRDLNYGGAQRQLITLVKAIDKQKFDITIFYFYANGFLEKDLKGTDIHLICLDKQARWHVFGFLWRLFRHLKQIKPDVIHGYLSESNLLTIFFKPLFLSTKVIWGIRHSDVNVNEYDWLEKLIFKIECLLSRFVDLVIVNSHAGRDYHLSQGFPKDKMIVIPNGIDTDRFKRDLEVGKSVRNEWQIPQNSILIGLIGRLAPVKDHPTFLKAAALICEEREDIRFVCIGNGSSEYATSLHELSQELGLGDRVIWAIGRSDMPNVYSALDIVCSSSAYGEGFGNVIGEAMACEVPCVVTDVGDSAWLVGDTGIVVPPGNPEALKNGLISQIDILFDNNLSSKTNIARQRIVEEFSVPQLALKTQSAILS